jgi:two-component system response regulator MprA
VTAEDVRAKVLVVDDDEGVTSVVDRALRREGYDVVVANNADDALAKVGGFKPDAAVLDIIMPGTDGLALCRQLRTDLPDLGILMVTAKDAASDQITGLDAGADDYLVKPFSLQVLAARLRAVLRRRQPTPEVISAGDLELDTANRRAKRRGRDIDLTATEYRLLSQLMREAGKAIPKRELTHRVWGYDFEGNDNVLEVYIGYLRSKLEAQGEPRVIHTLRGVGYELRPIEP